MHQFDFSIYTENENKEARNLFRAISVFFFRISLIVQFLFIVQLSKYTEGEHDFEPLLPPVINALSTSCDFQIKNSDIGLVYLTSRIILDLL